MHLFLLLITVITGKIRKIAAYNATFLIGIVSVYVNKYTEINIGSKNPDFLQNHCLNLLVQAQ